ncbi:MAG: hypothetical protein ACR2QJ_10505 [Geminicoccaceae bacterium]
MLQSLRSPDLNRLQTGLGANWDGGLSGGDVGGFDGWRANGPSDRIPRIPDVDFDAMQ